MNSHAYLARQLLEFCEISDDPTVKLLALLRSIEELAIYKYNIDDSLEGYQSVMLNYIKGDEKLYKLYSAVIDEMFNYLLENEVKLDDIIQELRAEVNQIIGT
ncbi:hypothetical protein [Saccharolobus shibatae]|uniref:hypothetical protein n=1 Tax=Saccharolobus shibatae TaxID=2286 RepID=UPI001C44F149|nr:hypothetical protein [Saccharolobus shibatae]